jgi:hypothetical protein
MDNERDESGQLSAEDQKKLENDFTDSVKFGASCLFAVGLLTLVDSIFSYKGIPFKFPFGIGNPLLNDMFLSENLKFTAFLITFSTSLMFVLFGLAARENNAFSFITGITIYFIDGFFYMGRDFLGALCHFVALVILLRSCEAGRLLRKFQNIEVKT